jgi:voltage-dependent calcium channel L type alpha-1C/voltage-dependent calcium channel L type alpha-1D
MPQNWVDIFETVNFMFMVIFTVEAIFKIVAMKCAYFKDSWNIFDFTVVILTLIIVIIGNIPGLNFDLGAQATVIRILRIMRVLRIVHRLKKL